MKKMAITERSPKTYEEFLGCMTRNMELFQNKACSPLLVWKD